MASRIYKGKGKNSLKYLDSKMFWYYNHGTKSKNGGWVFPG